MERGRRASFSALQRAEIAEIICEQTRNRLDVGFSALQRAEIAEINEIIRGHQIVHLEFQCSSTSRNC